MARRKRTSMYDQYRDDIVAALDAGKTIIQIYNEIIYPAMNGACEYSGLAYYVNKNGLRYVTENDGYEPVHICAECEHCGKIQRERFDPMSFCKKAEREILPVVKTYPRSEQVRRCGNAVCPPIPAALVRANLPELCVAERMPNMRIESEQTGQLRFA